LDYYLWWIGNLQPSRKISNNEIGKLQFWYSFFQVPARKWASDVCNRCVNFIRIKNQVVLGTAQSHYL
jgi:hypothetical protein